MHLLRKVSVKFETYKMLDGSERRLVKQVNDGSIIKRFDKTRNPQKKNDVVCPHFLELKWATGCPFNCAWCYLQGTLRFIGKDPKMKPKWKIEQHLYSFLIEENTPPEILNSGELSDSLIPQFETEKFSFSKFVLDIMKEYNDEKGHKILFVTKSNAVRHLIEANGQEYAIISFSINALPVADRWEIAPSVTDRLNAAKQIVDSGYVLRLRIDPMVPIRGWRSSYKELIDFIFSKYELEPERITLGSLRGLQSTINNSRDKSWTIYLKENSNWGKKIEFKKRYEMYRTIIDYLKENYDYRNIALCKETIEMWNALRMDYKKIKCNCIW